MKNQYILLILIAMMSVACSTQKKINTATVDASTIRIGFYNVENLFDTLDSPNVQDEDFTPAGKYQWNTARYEKKLVDLATVIDSLPGALPDIMGLCEIENRSVLEDLIRTAPLNQKHYAILHQDSPDERGIDVAVLVNTDVFEVIDTTWIALPLPNKEDPFTRDILHATLRLQNDKNRAIDLHFFVNHWPSRSGGQEVSEPNRIFAAQQLKAEVDKVKKANPTAGIVIVGDFNDHPDNTSILNTLQAGVDELHPLYNLMWDDHANKLGSYNYKGEWGALDQFIVNREMLSAKMDWKCNEGSAIIYRPKFLLYFDKDGQSKPNRTYAGDKYVGGYSDHLPVLLELQCE